MKKKGEKADGNGGEGREKKTKENQAQKRINPTLLLGTL